MSVGLVFIDTTETLNEKQWTRAALFIHIKLKNRTHQRALSTHKYRNYIICWCTHS